MLAGTMIKDEQGNSVTADNLEAVLIPFHSGLRLEPAKEKP